MCLCERNSSGVGAESLAGVASGYIKICSGRQRASLPPFFLRELSAMEPNDSTSTTMEEPESLEVLVKTLDSQTRTFIVGAQVRPQYFWKTPINSFCRFLFLR